MRDHRRFVCTALAMFVAAVGARAGAPAETAPRTPGGVMQVVATTSIIGDVVGNIAGEAASVTVLVGAGQNPHSFEATPAALRAVERAHVVFMNGFGLEEGLVATVRSTATGEIVEVSSGIVPLDSDPHVWMDPANVLIWIRNISATLSTTDPDNADLYRTNAEAYAERVRATDAEIRANLSEIPEARRRIVVDHYAFSYFARAYGFSVVGAIVPDSDGNAEPTAREVTQLVRTVTEEDVRAIFVGRSASRAVRELARTISEEVGGTVEIVETLTGSLAGPGNRGETYLDLLRYNTEQISRGVGAP